MWFTPCCWLQRWQPRGWSQMQNVQIMLQNTNSYLAYCKLGKLEKEVQAWSEKRPGQCGLPGASEICHDSPWGWLVDPGPPPPPHLSLLTIHSLLIPTVQYGHNNTCLTDGYCQVCFPRNSVHVYSEVGLILLDSCFQIIVHRFAKYIFSHSHYSTNLYPLHTISVSCKYTFSSLLHCWILF